MINQLLSTMYHLNIQIKEINYKTKLVYDPKLVDEEFKRLIKQHKDEILKRQEENEIAREQGFLVYHHGLIYEYQFGWGSFLYIERLRNNLTNVWRENYLPDQKKPNKIKIISEKVPFIKGFKDAQGFINWLNKRQPNRVRK